MYECFSLLHQRLLCSLHSALLYPNMRGASGQMKDVTACMALDEAIGQTSQGYQKWGARCSRVLGFKNALGGSQWDFCVI